MGRRHHFQNQFDYMMFITCKICSTDFQVKPYRAKTAVACCSKCRGIFVGRKLKGTNIKGHPAWNKGLHINLNPSGGYKKGHAPWNKDLKGIHLSPASELKPGRREKHYVPNGTIRLRVDKQDKPRNHIKIAEGKWSHLSRFLWVQAYGPIPDGMVIHHINDISNDDWLENYAMLTKSEHARLHKMEKLTSKKATKL